MNINVKHIGHTVLSATTEATTVQHNLS